MDLIPKHRFHKSQAGLLQISNASFSKLESPLLAWKIFSLLESSSVRGLEKATPGECRV